MAGIVFERAVKIRWKLFLSLFLLTSLVTLVLLAGVEMEFRNWVSQQVTESFADRVDALLTGRKTRLESVRETAAKLSTEAVVRETLQGTSTPKQRNALLDSYGKIRSAAAGERQPNDPDRSGKNNIRNDNAAGISIRQQPLMGVVNLKGDFEFFGQAVTVRNKRRRNAAVKRLEDIQSGNEQVVSYVVINRESGPGQVREVVVTPVDAGGQRLGWFFMGLNAETSVELAFQELEDASNRGIRSGLVVGDEWFVQGIEPGILVEFSAGVDDEFWSDGKPEIVEAGGSRYLLIARDLNPGSPLGKGYQVGIYPLADLVQAIEHLRWVVAGMALAALVVTGGMALFLARRFSRPIDELVKGTNRVREGDFQNEVKIHSKDEFGMLATSFNMMTRDLELKEKYRDLLGKTSDPGLVQSLLEGRIELGGEIRHAAVLFCDIRGFTAMTDGMHPAGVIDLLNGHMIAMTRIIHDHGGVVDKFVGDLVMAVFGVPVGRDGDLERSLDCALAMHNERERLNREGPPAIETGIGIAWGEVVAGLMGSRERMNYTVLGERVNMAARLCSAAGAGEIVVDRATVDAMGDPSRFEMRGEMPMKGFKAAVEVWSLRRDS